MISSNYPDEPGFKAGGTSAQAAIAIQSDAEELREQCLALLQKDDLTPDEIAEKLGKYESRHCVRSRCSELIKLGSVFKTSVRRKNKSGHSANVLTAKSV
jgi:hypothetical protein